MRVTMSDAPPAKKAKATKKVALITGITGQDGSYLAEFLLEKDYEVHGIIRRSSSFNTGRLEHIYKDYHGEDVRFFLHYGDLTDSTNLYHIISVVKPDEIYNLGAMSHVKVSFEMSEYTAEADGIGTLRLLNALRSAGLEKTCRLYQASTSELYGKVQAIPQSETTPFYPRSPYAAAKLYAVARQPKAFSSELALQLLYAHAFDVLAATHPEATSSPASSGGCSCPGRLRMGSPGGMKAIARTTARSGRTSMAPTGSSLRDGAWSAA